MRLFQRRSPAVPEQHPAPIDPATHAGSQQLGGDVGHGQVPAHRAFTGHEHGQVAMLGTELLASNAVMDAIRIPESWYADRPQYGGVRAFPSFGEYVDDPGNTGGYGVIVGRTRVQLNDAVIMADPAAVPGVVRVAPAPSLCRQVPGVSGQAPGDSSGIPVPQVRA